MPETVPDAERETDDEPESVGLCECVPESERESVIVGDADCEIVAERLKVAVGDTVAVAERQADCETVGERLSDPVADVVVESEGECVPDAEPESDGDAEPDGDPDAEKMAHVELFSMHTPDAQSASAVHAPFVLRAARRARRTGAAPAGRGEVRSASARRRSARGGGIRSPGKSA